MPLCIYDQKLYSENAITEKVNFSTNHNLNRPEHEAARHKFTVCLWGLLKVFWEPWKSQTEAQIEVERKEMTRLYHTQNCIMFHMLIIDLS